MKAYQQVDVVICPTNGNRFAFKLPTFFCNSSIKFGFDMFTDERHTVPGGPNKMDIKSGIFNWHMIVPILSWPFIRGIFLSYHA